LEGDLVIDLHSHYVPLEAAQSAGVGIDLTLLPDDDVRFETAGRIMLLEAALFDLERQQEDMARQGLERRILTIPPFCFEYELPAGSGLRWAQHLNDGIAAAAAANPAAFVGFATLPMQDVEAALTELDRAVGELGLRGLEIATNINGVELDDAALEPFWQRVEQLGVPVLIHPHYVVGPERMRDYYLRNLVGNPVETALAGARLVLGGVLERYPNLKLILSHGGGALPGIFPRIMHGYGVRPESRLRAEDPRLGFQRLHFDTIVFEAPALRQLVQTVGASQVILGTDYPFDMSLSDPVAFVEGSGLSAETVQQIYDNGERLLGGR
jgi:aminocarboxymuconate-semialdehyde decarboxylase